LIDSKEITKLSDVILLESLCSQTDDKQLYVEFTSRFLPELTSECEKICATRKLHKHIGIQIAHDTLEKVRKYKTFKKDGIKAPTTRQGILLYLFRISTNLFNDHYNKAKALESRVLHKTYFDELLDFEHAEVDVVKLKNTKEIAVKLFSCLNEKEKKVIITDIDYKKFNKYLPDDVNQKLAIELNVKSETIRKIRERAITKLKKALYDFNTK
jgi:DNA-directed RNA polymerase specialized sigma24 family protein